MPKSRERTLETPALAVDDETPSRRLAFADLAVGQAVAQTYTFDRASLAAFGVLANDQARVHVNEAYAREAGFAQPIVQGLALVTRFSRLIGMYLPGERAVMEKIAFAFHEPVYLAERIVYTARITRLLRPLRVVQLALTLDDGTRTRIAGECQCIVR